MKPQPTPTRGGDWSINEAGELVDLSQTPVAAKPEEAAAVAEASEAANPAETSESAAVPQPPAASPSRWLGR